ncbi:hypothetical protein [Yokenella regensburgei]|uniref:hypothetical protein n=1 Tax=Yokenella regensburgei TaxID=158877 RepID=UPI001375E83E|nr:hypothetical protein [Yokenella regensburgei]KAF1367519.1 hypothetical protein FHR25_003945 [Yokenella regensburgei]
MAIVRIEFNGHASSQKLIDLLVVICCQRDDAYDCAFLSGGEISCISPRNRLHDLPENIIKILSSISRRGFAFHVSGREDTNGIFIARQLNTLKKNIQGVGHA